MRFFIYRTSRGFYSDERPIDGAIRRKYTPKDVRSVDDPIKIPAYRDNPEKARREWYEEGYNHRVENGRIVRDMEPQFAWYIEIGSLKQLVNLMQEHGEIILRETPLTGIDGPAIEIYDDYRE